MWRTVGLTLLLALVVRAESAPSGHPAKSPTEAWRRLSDTQGDGCDAGDLVNDYWPEGGIRNFYCRVLTLFSWNQLMQLAGRSPFLSGPHSISGLNLHHKTEFGHYDPEFVRFINRALVPAARDTKLRAQTQLDYDRFVRTLARTYYVVYAKMHTRPEWVDEKVKRYLAAAEKGVATEQFWEFSSFMSSTGFSRTPSEFDWGGYDPNLQRTAVLFWLRRTSDQTASLFFEGLNTLLTTYDRSWLEGQHSNQPGSSSSPKRSRLSNQP